MTLKISGRNSKINKGKRLNTPVYLLSVARENHSYSPPISRSLLLAITFSLTLGDLTQATTSLEPYFSEIITALYARR